MRCTRCSAPVKPIVALDIDGTLGDYHQHFINFAQMYLGQGGRTNIEEYDGSRPFRYWFKDYFNVDVRTFRDIKLAYRQGAQKRSMPVRPFARGLIRRLRDLDAEIWITTTRPYMRLDNVDPDTRFWLKRHGLKFDHLLYDDHKYELLAQQVDPDRVCAVLDDLNENLVEAEHYFGADSCVLYGNSWNTAYWESWTRVSSSEEVHNVITGKVIEWNETHSL